MIRRLAQRRWPLCGLACLLGAHFAGALAAKEPADVPTPPPATRAELKSALEALTLREARIPPTGSTGQSPAYVPPSWGGGLFGILGQTAGRGRRDRQGVLPHPDEDPLFTDPAFWIVSRANNCLYCLGHQELKLRAAGLDDGTIAALDGDWNDFNAQQRAVLAFARKLSVEPASVDDADVAALRRHLSDNEVIELAFTVAQFNGVNRWTAALGLPLEKFPGGDGRSAFNTPTAAAFQDVRSLVMPHAARSPLPSTAEITAAIAASRTRTPRVALPAEVEAARTLAGAIGERAPRAWERAASAVPSVGKTYVVVWNAILADDHLPPRLKAELAYVSAVHNRAWYAIELAANRLEELGASPREIARLAEPSPRALSGAEVAHSLAAKLTATPHLVVDGDVARLRKHFSDAEAAQILYVICMANVLDRLTAALDLAAE